MFAYQLRVLTIFVDNIQERPDLSLRSGHRERAVVADQFKLIEVSDYLNLFLSFHCPFSQVPAFVVEQTVGVAAPSDAFHEHSIGGHQMRGFEGNYIIEMA